MPRRAGKAANRRARQRNVPRSPRPTPAPPSTPLPPVGTPDAREAIALDPPTRLAPSPVGSTGSTLTARERAEYHYVERDLRSIGVLFVIMVGILLAAWAAFSALGVIQ